MNLRIRSACCAPSYAIKIETRNEFAQSAGNYLHVYTKLKQQTQHTHAGTHTHTQTHAHTLTHIVVPIKGVNLHRKQHDPHINCAINGAKSAKKRMREQMHARAGNCSITSIIF